jgi:hypothetical protein
VSAILGLDLAALDRARLHFANRLIDETSLPTR